MSNAAAGAVEDVDDVEDVEDGAIIVNVCCRLRRWGLGAGVVCGAGMFTARVQSAWYLATALAVYQGFLANVAALFARRHSMPTLV